MGVAASLSADLVERLFVEQEFFSFDQTCFLNFELKE